jgi:hypothetical protein
MVSSFGQPADLKKKEVGTFQATDSQIKKRSALFAGQPQPRKCRLLFYLAKNEVDFFFG